MPQGTIMGATEEIVGIGWVKVDIPDCKSNRKRSFVACNSKLLKTIYNLSVTELGI